MRRRTIGVFVMSILAVVAICAQFALAGPVQSVTACLKIEPKVPLGTAVYSWWDDDTRRLEIEVSDVADGNYCIFVDKVKLDAKLVVVDGAGALRLDTRWGDAVPLIESGSTIALKYCLDTTVVICGKFV